MTPINQNWQDEYGNHQGGTSTGTGFTIAWQRGPLTEGRNGAFLIEVLEACQSQINYVNQGKFNCTESTVASELITDAIKILSSRSERRLSEGTLGTHQPESKV